MKITRTLLLTVIGAVLLAGLTTTLRAQTTKPAGTAKSDPPPVLNEGDRSGNESGPGDSSSSNGDKGDPNAPAASQPAGGPAKTAPSLFSNPMLLLIGAMLLMFIFMGRGKRKKESQRKQMLAALKKGDKVTTIGGIIGTVLEARDDEVIVKIDESNNARMRFARWAVRGVGEEAKSEGPEEKK